MANFRIIVTILVFLLQTGRINAQLTQDGVFTTLFACQQLCDAPNTCTPMENAGFLRNWKCVADCGSPNVPLGGSASVPDGTLFESQAYYGCDSGYQLNGVSERTCLSTAQWSSSMPSCDAIANVTCPELNFPCNGVTSYTGRSVGDRVQFSCDTGYVLSVPGDALRYCMADGTWNASSPCCLPVTCPPLSPPTDGSITFSDFYNYNSVATYTCNTCYSASSGSTTRTCNSTGQWSGSEPTCSLTRSGFDVAFQGSCYQFNNNTEVDWETALGLCNDSMGAHLVEINSAAEDCFVVTSIQATGAPNKFWWIGGTDLDKYSTEGTFVWQSTLQPIGPYLNWRSGQPDDDAIEEDCMAIIMVSYQWVDRPCEFTFGYICEIEE